MILSIGLRAGSRVIVPHWPGRLRPSCLRGSCAAKLGIDRQLNINFLPKAVYEPRGCIRLTLDAATRTGFDKDRLTFEIVESEDIADTDHLKGIITEYRRHGFKVALDDFSTGYSGLSRLAELKPDIVKLDRALIKDCDQDRVRLAIIASMIALGAEVGIKMVLEGVERIGEVEALRSVGGRFMQGFYFARPLFEGIVRDQAIWPSPTQDRSAAGECLSELSERYAELNRSAGDCSDGSVDVASALVAQDKPAEAVDLGEGAIDDPSAEACPKVTSC